MGMSGTRLLLAAVLGLVALPHLAGSTSTEERRFLRQAEKAFSINLPGVSIHVGDDAGNSTTETDENTASPINYSDYVRKHGIDTARGKGAEAVCLMQKDMDNDGTLCLAGASWLALTKIVPPQLGAGTVSKRPKDPSGNNSLPLPLTLLTPLPAAIDAPVVAEEKQTYYWYFRLVLNFYAELTSWKRREDVDLSLPEGWEHLKLYNTTLEDGDGGVTAPLAASFSRDGHLVILVRGTVYAEEWQRDFNYAWTGAKNTTRQGFKGRVHAGFFDVFSLIVDDVQAEVSARNPSRVTVVGHSLGGAVSSVLSYHLATNRGNRTTAIEAISFAGPMVGDEDFTRDFNSKVNHRHVTFTGTGTRGSSYNIGDFISQIPCGTVSSCPLLDTFNSREENSTFTYGRLGGEVAFTYQDLKNTDVWQVKSDLTSFFYAPLASHLCSYSCFLAPSVGDREDHCFFPLDWEPNVAIRHRCNLLF